MNLFLDDIRLPKDAFLLKELKYLRDYSGISDNDWKIVRNYDEFVKAIEDNGIPVAISFDCDLSLEHQKHYIRDSINTGVYEWQNFKTKCGIHCAKYLKSLLNEDSCVKVYVHSANEIGGEEIRKILKEYLA